VWVRYADPVMVSVMALLAIPTPVRVLQRSLREVLLMAVADDAVTRRLEAVLEAVRAEHDIVRYVHHVLKTGRTRFIEVDIVVGPNFSLQTVAQQDRLRERIWRALELPLEDAWLSICLTEDPRWV
jgi:predicted Co/Zn/Cd cation transporter (cation efflux family)